MNKRRILVIGTAVDICALHVAKALVEAGNEVILMSNDDLQGRTCQSATVVVENDEKDLKNRHKMLYKSEMIVKFEERLEVTAHYFEGSKERSAFKRKQKYAKRKFF